MIARMQKSRQNIKFVLKDREPSAHPFYIGAAPGCWPSEDLSKARVFETEEEAKATVRSMLGGADWKVEQIVVC